MTVSLATDHLGIVLELNGIINANLIAFILPGACGAALLPGETFYRGKRLAASLLCLFGLAV
jgi:sodium-coupled neutral amino acid transporter 11